MTTDHPAPDRAPPPVFDARALVAPSDRAVLVLDGKHYVLRITRGGKLILTK